MEVGGRGFESGKGSEKNFKNEIRETFFRVGEICSRSVSRFGGGWIFKGMIMCETGRGCLYIVVVV